MSWLRRISRRPRDTLWRRWTASFPPQGSPCFTPTTCRCALAADSAGHAQQFRDVAAQSGEEFLKQVDLAGSPGRKPDLLLEEGEPDRLLHDYARDMDVDLVALGSHGRSAVYEILLGSIAQRLLHLLPCDVLLVREPRAAAA